MSPDQYISSGILELYAAGVLPPEEMESMESAISQHPRVQEELKTILEAYRRYAQFHSSKELPDSVLETIIDKINQLPVPAPPSVKSKGEVKPKPEVKTAKASPAPAPAPAPASASAPVSAPSPSREPIRNIERPVIPKKEETSSPRRSNAGLVFSLILCLLLLIAGALFIYYLANEWQKTKEELSDLKTEHQRVNQAYNELKSAPAPAPVNGDVEIMQDMNYRILRLKGQTPAPEAEAILFWNKNDGKLYLRVYNIPAPPAGKQYQLWAIMPDNKAVDAGLITHLQPEKTLHPMKPVNTAKAFAVTLEREGGNTEPTSAVYMQVNI